MLDIKITNAKTRNTGKELVEIGIESRLSMQKETW